MSKCDKGDAVKQRRKDIPMNRPYFTLLTFENGIWSPQFGDYDKACVLEEKQDYREKGYRTGCLMIIKSANSRKNTVETDIAKINATGLVNV